MPQCRENPAYAVGVDAFELISDEAEIDRIASEWADLVDRTAAPSVFLTPEFLRAWWVGYGGDLLMHLVTVRRDDRLVVVAPLALGSDPGRWRGTALTGWANEYTDRFAVLADADHLDAVESLAGHIRDLPGWDVLDLPVLEAGSLGTAALTTALRGAGIGLRHIPGLQSPWIALPDSFETLEERLSKSFRSTMRRKRRAADRDGLTVAIERDVAALDEAFAIAETGWAHEEGTSIASSQANRRFVTSLAEAAAASGWLRLAMMRDGARPVAFELNLARTGQAVNLKVGFDPEYKSASPGLALRAAVVESLIEEGARSFDLLGEAEPYKMHWTDLTRKHVRLRGYPPTFKGRWDHVYRNGIRPAVGRAVDLARRTFTGV